MEITKFLKTRIRRFSFRGLSIQQRLPLLICVLLLCIMVTFSCISYFSVKNAALRTGKERLRSLSDQLSSMFAQSAQTIIAATRAAASQEPVKKYLQPGGSEFKTEALEALQKLRLDSTWVLSELLNASRQPILRSGRDSIQSRINFDTRLTASIHADSAGIGKIYLLKDSMYYPIIVPVIDNKKLVGHLVRWRMITATAKALEQLSQLMGTKAKLYVGNIDGSLWTDMIKPVSYLQLNTAPLRGPFEYTGPDGKRVIVSAQPIANTPWLVSVEFPRQSVLITANHFLNWMIIIGSVLIAIGIFIAWLMSRNITRPLNRLTAAASAIAGGNYSTTVAVGRRDELGKLASAFNSMIGQVAKAREGLEQKIIETGEMNEQLRSLSTYLLNVREDERMHIAREMHDELGQLLTGFKMDVSWLRKRLIENNDPVVKERLEIMLTFIDEAVKFVRKLATELRPSLLDDLGLIPALEWHSQEFAKRYHINTELHSEMQELNTSPAMATGLFRIYQESLTNVVRHSNANKVVVSLREINGEISLSIADNGKGFDASQASKNTLGLLGMKERAAMLGGKLEIISEAGKGTTVLITVKQEQPRTVAFA